MNKDEFKNKAKKILPFLFEFCDLCYNSFIYANPKNVRENRKLVEIIE